MFYHMNNKYLTTSANHTKYWITIQCRLRKIDTLRTYYQYRCHNQNFLIGQSNRRRKLQIKTETEDFPGGHHIRQKKECLCLAKTIGTIIVKCDIILQQCCSRAATLTHEVETFWRRPNLHFSPTKSLRSLCNPHPMATIIAWLSIKHKAQGTHRWCSGRTLRAPCL